MKRLMTICTIGLVLAVNSAVVADSYTPTDAYLMDTTNWVNTGYADGTLYGRTDLPGPGVRYEISLDTITWSPDWSDMQIGDDFDLPADNSGLATGLPLMGSDFTGYDTYELVIHNPNQDISFMANLTANSGWTDVGHVSEYRENGWTWLNPGDTKTFAVDLTGFTYINEVSNIAFKIGANISGSDVASGAWNQNMGPGVKFNVDVAPVPVPGAVLLGILGLSAVGVKLRKSA